MPATLEAVSPPSLDVIIPNWNGGPMLGECLQSLARWSEGVALRVVVFDNGSTDDPVAMIDGLQLRLALTILRADRNLGYAEANNRAYGVTTSPYVLLLNNDAVVCGPLSLAVRHFAAHPGLGICQGPIHDADGRFIDSAGSLFTVWGFLRHIHMGESVDPPKPSRGVFCAKGAAMFLRRQCISEVGLFDPAAFAYFEEADLCWRARLAGWEVDYVASLPVVRHRTGTTSTRLDPSLIEFHSFKNRLRSLLKNSSTVTLVRVMPRHVMLCATLAVSAALLGRPAAIMNIARAFSWNLRHLSETLALRREVQHMRKRSDRDALGPVTAPLALGDLFRAGRRYERGKKAPGKAMG